MEEEREVTARAFGAYGSPLEMVTSFKYLGRVISEADGDGPAVVKKFYRSNNIWSRMPRILSKEGAAPLVSGFFLSRLFFKAVVHTVLLFGEDTWLVTPAWERPWVGVQTQVERRLTVRVPWKTPDRRWGYTLAVATAREEAGFLTMEEYIRRRQNTVAHYIATRSMLELFEGSERDPGGVSRYAVVGTGGN